MSNIIDRRLNGKNKSSANRQRFIERLRPQIKRKLEEVLYKGKLSDMDKDQKINIPERDLNEPTFRHGPGGVRDIILPGNIDFMPGDLINRKEEEKIPPTGGGYGDVGEDDFTFTITKEEFLDVLFHDLALPNFVKSIISDKNNSNKLARGGYTKDGSTSSINIVHSIKNAIGRKIIFQAGYQEEIDILLKKVEELEMVDISNPEITELKEKIKELEELKENVPFIDTVDIRHNNYVEDAVPVCKAVMFCLMDVSGSMGEMEKRISKTFFLFLYLFLNKNYERLDIVFITHHMTAKEVSENDFFYSKENGGTVVSSCLELMNEIINDRYNLAEWNIYGAQASDGDNMYSDSQVCERILVQDILPKVQYFTYIEIAEKPQDLWVTYQKMIDSGIQKMCIQRAKEPRDVYQAFRDLFEKK